MASENQKTVEYTNVWVYCELRDGNFIPADFELVSEARRLADDLQEKVCCLVVGKEVTQPLQILGGYGADEVLACRNALLSDYTTAPYAAVVCDVISKYKPRIFLFPASFQGRDLAPRCAARVRTGLTANCSRLDVDPRKYAAYLEAEAGSSNYQPESDEESMELKMTRPAFGNHLMATITCPNTRPCMCTVHPGVMECAAYQSEWAKKCLVEMREFDLADVMIRAPVVEQLQNIEEKCSLEEAQRIVCVGRGIVKDPQKGMKLANELASLLGAQIAGSRAAIDAGWLDESRLIGQTGKSVRPALYIALGVSGAMQHLVGMKNSGSVLAINKDPNAPIFSVADYSMVGDVYQILPILIEELKNIAKGGTEHDR